MLTHPHLASCGVQGCQWEQAYSSREEADRRLSVHLNHAHAFAPLEGVTQLVTVSWRERAIDALRAVAARGEDFRTFDVVPTVGDPPNPQSAWGTLATDLHRLGIAHPVDYQPSKRPGTNRSAAAVWNQNAARCVAATCPTRKQAAS